MKVLCHPSLVVTRTKVFSFSSVWVGLKKKGTSDKGNSSFPSDKQECPFGKNRGVHHLPVIKRVNKCKQTLLLINL